jgi:hypothetical protein
MFFKANSNFVGIGDEDPGENLVVRLNTRAVLPTPANYSGIQIKPTSAAGGSSNDYGFHFGLDNTLQRTARITNYEAGDLWFGFNDNDVLHLINGSRFVGVNEISPLDNLTIRLNPAGILPSPDPYSGLLIHSPTQAGFGNNFGLHIGLDNAFFRTARIMNNENEDLFLGTNKIEMIRLKGSNRFVGVNTSNPFHSFSVMVGANAIFTSPYDGLSVMTPNNPANSTSGLVVGSDPTFYPDKGIWNYDNGKIAFGTNNAERAVITDDGKLGIGTAFPTALLDINDNTIRVRTAKTPASSLDTGNTGDIAWDSNYIYVCIAANTWKRVGIATW